MKNSRHPPRRPPPRPSSPALRNGIRRPQLRTDMLRQAGDNLWRGALVVVHVGLGPAGEGEAGFEGVELYIHISTPSVYGYVQYSGLVGVVRTVSPPL